MSNLIDKIVTKLVSHTCHESRVPCLHVSQVSSLHEVYLLLDTDEAAAALQLRESLDTLHQGEASLHNNIAAPRCDDAQVVRTTGCCTRSGAAWSARPARPSWTGRGAGCASPRL